MCVEPMGFSPFPTTPPPPPPPGHHYTNVTREALLGVSDGPLDPTEMPRHYAHSVCIKEKGAAALSISYYFDLGE